MTEPLALAVAERLVAASWQGALLAAAVWVVCRVVRGIPPGVQAALWWLAAARFVVALLPLPAVTLAVLPTQEPPAPMSRWSPAAEPQGVLPPEERDSIGSGAYVPAAVPRPSSLTWTGMLVTLWAGVALVQFVMLGTAFWRHSGRVARAAPCTGEQIAAAARLAGVVGLPQTPDVRTSREIDMPQVCGVWRPVVLVPPQFEQSLSPAEREMTLAHELLHVRRHDLAWGWMPAAAERLFFFHPLARLAAREYLAAREAACDAAVVRVLGLEPATYGRLLVRLGVSASPSPVASAAPASLSVLRRRLQMLQHSRSIRLATSRAILAVAVCTFVPVQLGAQDPARPPVPPAEPRAVVPGVTPVAPSGAVPAARGVSRAAARTVAPPRPVVRSTNPLTAVVSPEGQAVRSTRPVAPAVRQGDAAGRSEEAAEVEARTAEMQRTLDELVREFEAARRQPSADPARLAEQARALAERLRAAAAGVNPSGAVTQADAAQRQVDRERLAFELAAITTRVAETNARLTEVQEQLREVSSQREALGRLIQELEARQRQLRDELERVRSLEREQARRLRSF